MTNTEQFEKLWNNFYTVLKGKMIYGSQSHEITYSYVYVVLEETKSYWENDAAARWLNELCESYPSQGRMINSILLNDISFKPIDVKTDKSLFKTGAACVGSAVAGFGISNVFGASSIVTSLATVLPPLITAPIMKEKIKNENEKHRADTINQYLAQLDKYKISVISTLQAL